MKILTVVFILAVGATAVSLALYANNSESMAKPIDSQKAAMLNSNTNDRYTDIFPRQVERGTDRHIILSETNRQKYVAHYQLKKDASWNVIQREAVERILYRANQTE
jgi:predicted transcriptional regulator